MQTYSATEARKNIYFLLTDVEDNHRPVQITGKNNNAVLISESDWNAIQETLYLMSIPGMAKSIIEGMNTPLEECHESLFDNAKSPKKKTTQKKRNSRKDLL